MRILFYLPVITPWWFDNIVAPLIARLAADNDAIHRQYCSECYQAVVRAHILYARRYSPNIHTVLAFPSGKPKLRKT